MKQVLNLFYVIISDTYTFQFRKCLYANNGKLYISLFVHTYVSKRSRILMCKLYLCIWVRMHTKKKNETKRRRFNFLEGEKRQFAIAKIEIEYESSS